MKVYLKPCFYQLVSASIHRYQLAGSSRKKREVGLAGLPQGPANWLTCMAGWGVDVLGWLYMSLLTVHDIQQLLLLLLMLLSLGMGIGMDHSGGMRARLPIGASILGRGGAWLQCVLGSWVSCTLEGGRCMGLCIDNRVGENACRRLRPDKGFSTGDWVKSWVWRES